MIESVLPKRGTDDWGSGAFGANRGDRTHKGIDYACYPATVILSPVSGECTKLGYPYADDLAFRYVQITDSEGWNHRFFYVEPSIDVGEPVQEMEIIGTAQDIAGRYNEPNKIMRNHIHYEILVDGEPINPEGA